VIQQQTVANAAGSSRDGRLMPQSPEWPIVAAPAGEFERIMAVALPLNRYTSFCNTGFCNTGSLIPLIRPASR
jgi:hypothetical protein